MGRAVCQTSRRLERPPADFRHVQGRVALAQVEHEVREDSDHQQEADRETDLNGDGLLLRERRRGRSHVPTGHEPGHGEEETDDDKTDNQTSDGVHGIYPI